MVASSLRMLVTALFVGGLAGASGCCESGLLCVEVKSAEDGGSLEDEAGGDVIATEGCAVEDIETQNGGACATCSGVAANADARDPQTGEPLVESGEARICGPINIAPCNNQENALGDVCQRCETADGQVLFDDCPVGQDDLDAAYCESFADDPSQPIDGQESTCSVCYDDAGSVVSSACEPTHDECHDNNGCRDCTLNGQLVIHDCGDVELDPRECESYENEVGRCVDCYDDHDQIILHQCTLAGDQFVSCVETIDPAGLACFTCVDQNGVTLSSDCSTALPEARSCQLLEYTSQTCLVCIDDIGEAVAVECSATNCANDGTACPPPPACESTRDADGQLCRTCFDETLQQEETRCLSALDLICENVNANDLEESPGAPLPPDQTACVSCRDVNTGAEVYVSCGGEAAPPDQPYCVDTQDPAGQACTVCYDPTTDAPVYSSCDGGQTCYVTAERELTSADGAALGTVASCYACGDEALSDANQFSSLCTLPQCTGPDGFVDPGATGECPNVFALLLAPKQCGNGWDAYGAPAASEDEIVAVLGWAASELAVTLASIGTVATNEPVEQCDPNTCSACARGDLFVVGFGADQADGVRTQMADLLVPCGTDADCPASALCLDSACGY